MKKMKKYVMTIVMVLSVMMMAATAGAVAKPQLNQYGNGSYYYTQKNQKKYNRLPIYIIRKGDRVLKAKSSNPRVASVSIGKYYGQKAVMLKAKKAGKTKISVNVRRGKKTYKLSRTITFLKSDAFKTVRIGNSKNLANMLNGYHAKSSNMIKTKALSGTLQIELNSGWTVKSMQLITEEYDEEGELARTSTVEVQNGSDITIRAGSGDDDREISDQLHIVYTNAKTKQTMIQDIGCYIE